jgi:hypothetical protein
MFLVNAIHTTFSLIKTLIGKTNEKNLRAEMVLVGTDEIDLSHLAGRIFL